MWKFNNQTRINPPANIVVGGFVKKFTDVLNGGNGREVLDGLGYNEYVPIKREPFHTYATHDEKGTDFIIREVIDSDIVDEAARDGAVADTARTTRNSLLSACDWTQLADSALDGEAMVLWQAYRQALRDIPQQPGFPRTVDWPQQPEIE